jgi:flagellar hook-associated protein 2
MMMMVSSPQNTFLTSSSGLNVNGTISGLMAVERQPINQLQTRISQTRQRQTAAQNLKSRTQTLQTAINKLTGASVLDGNIFQSKQAASSLSDNVTVTAGDAAAIQSFKVQVNQLATATQASSTNNLGQFLSGTSNLSDYKNSVFSTGDFTVLVNGVASKISVNGTTDKVDDVLGRLNAIGGVSASIDAQGRLNIGAAVGTNLQLGATGDTANFLKLAKLDTAVRNTTTGAFTGGQSLTTLDASKDVSTAASGLNTLVTAGSQFKIGKATFNSTGKSLADLVSTINQTPDAGVTASINSSSGKLELTSRTTGNTAIYLEDLSGGNFLQATGLIGPGGSTVASQTMGTNASFSLNGSTDLIYSTSNTVNETVSGLTGVTLELKKADTTPTSLVSINITRNETALKDALNTMLTQLNDLVGTIDTTTNSRTGTLGANNSMRAFRNQLRNSLNGTITGVSGFTSLGDLGITTGSVGGSAGGTTGSPKFQLNATKLSAALLSNPQGVQDALTGTNGLLTALKKQVNESLSTGSISTGNIGLFQALDDGFNAQVTRMNASITTKNALLVRKEATLRRQFTTSETLVGQYQSQGAAVSSLANSLG